MRLRFLDEQPYLGRFVSRGPSGNSGAPSTALEIGTLVVLSFLLLVVVVVAVAFPNVLHL